MLTHTTCAGCGGVLILEPHIVVSYGHLSHPQCPKPGDQASLLRDQFIQAVHSGETDLADRLAVHLDTLADRPPDMPASARVYACWGWPIFPLKPGHKIPMIARRDGGSGLLDATTDIDKIDDWWWRWPHAGIAVATGWMFDVIDLDGPPGYEWLRAPGHIEALPAVHGKVSTPRGIHLYIEPSGGGNKAGIEPGVDYRGRGGYVILPPTRLIPAAYDGKDTPSTLDYSWLVYPSPAIKRKAVST